MNTLARRLRVATIVTATVGISFGCVAKDDDNPPDLPPVGSLTTDVEVLNGAPPAAKNAPLGPTATGTDGAYQNFANAWLRVKVVQLYGAGIILLPAAVMGAALTQEPQQRGDTWVWTISALGATADLEVSANLVSGWDIDLYISNADLSRYLWIEGDFALDLTEGTWAANDHNQSPGSDRVLEISWNYNSETDRSLEYRNVNSESEDVGDAMRFTLNGTAATLAYTDASDSNVVANIEWDTGTGHGSIQVPHYNNGDKACWDSGFEDTLCAASN